VRGLWLSIVVAGCIGTPELDDAQCSRQTSKEVPYAPGPVTEPRPVIGYPCMDDDIDLDPVADGLQAHCVGELRSGLDGPGTSLPACGDPLVGPCWRIIEDPINCTASPGARALDVYFGPVPPVPRIVRLDCELACEPAGDPLKSGRGHPDPGS
jgi:hypothetical protein